jgi:hypothetical protein
MPLLDHFHPPLRGPRRWEGFHHGWALGIARQLNLNVLPKEYYAEPEISIGPELEVDVATMEWMLPQPEGKRRTLVWAPAKPKFSVKVNFSRLDGYEIRVYKDLGGAQLCAAIELVSPANKDRPGSRQTFAAKCAGYLKHGIGLLIIDVVTEKTDNLHEELFNVLEANGRRAVWKSPTNLYSVSYRAVTSRKEPRLDVWPEALSLGRILPVMPLWLSLELSVPLDLEASYVATCESLRIPAA